MDIGDIRKANKAAGHHWFDPDSMRFFRSRIGSKVYEGPGGIYFVSSEQFVGSDWIAAPRRYTVRKFDPTTGGVDTAGESNKLSRRAALACAKLAAAAEGSGWPNVR